MRSAIRPRTREAGERAWQQASWRLCIVLGFLVVIFVSGGFALGKGGIIGLTVSVAGLALLVVIERWTAQGGWLDALPWLTGYRGERTVRDLLGMLPTGFAVSHGIPYTDEAGHRHDIDHVVVGPTGVFVVETKNWNGTFSPGAGDRLLHNGIDETRVLRQATAEAMALRRMLNERQFFPRWVQAIVVSTRATVGTPSGRLDFRYVTVLGASDLVPHVRDRRDQGDRLSEEQVSVAARVLREL